MGNSPFFVGLLIAAAVLGSGILARRTQVPLPVFLVVGGVVASYVPAAPAFELQPNLIFYVFLPPLVYYAAFRQSPRALRVNWAPITVMAFGLVLVTMVATAFAARAVAGLSLGAAFVLGAVVAPTDPVAATAVLHRLGAPRRLSLVLEGESLANDGIALVLYSLALDAVTTGSFSLAHGAVRFVEVVAGGVAWGLVVGWSAVFVRRRIADVSTEITLSLLTPFVAYLPADRVGVSAVLATVVTGLYVGFASPGFFRPGARLQAFAFWEQLDFLLNSVLFVLLGLQFRAVVHDRARADPLGAALEAAAVAAVVIAVRIGWQFAVPRRVWTVGDVGDAPTSWRERLLMGWGGMRGAISLAAALAVPFSVRAGERATILYLTFVTILATLVVEGTTLPWLIRALHLGGGEAGDLSEAKARLAMVEAALARVEKISSDGAAPEAVVAVWRERYERRRRMAEVEVHGPDEDQEVDDELSRVDHDRLRSALIGAERGELNRRYRAGLVSLEATRRLRRELDLQEELVRE